MVQIRSAILRHTVICVMTVTGTVACVTEFLLVTVLGVTVVTV